MDKVEVNNPFGGEYPEEYILEIANMAISMLRKESIAGERTKFELSIALVGKKEILKLNEQYRGKSQPTDVLSFCYENNNDLIQGEIILCPLLIEQNAKTDKIEMKQELKKNVVHGILHVAGFEHGEEMSGLQKKILQIK